MPTLAEAKTAGNALFAKKAYREAIYEYTRGLDQDSHRSNNNNPDQQLLRQKVLANRSLCFYNLKNFNQACQDAHSCIAEGENTYPRGWFRYGMAAHRLHTGPELETAAEYFQKCLDLEAHENNNNSNNNNLIASASSSEARVERDKVLDQLEKSHRHETMSLCNMHSFLRTVWFNHGFRDLLVKHEDAFLQKIETDQDLQKKYNIEITPPSINKHCKLTVLQMALIKLCPNTIRINEGYDEPINGVMNCYSDDQTGAKQCDMDTNLHLRAMLPEWDLQEMKTVAALVKFIDGFLDHDSGFDMIQHVHDNILLKRLGEYVKQAQEDPSSVETQYNSKKWFLFRCVRELPDSFDPLQRCDSSENQCKCCHEGSRAFLYCYLLSGKYMRQIRIPKKHQDVVPQQHRRKCIKLIQVVFDEIFPRLFSLFASAAVPIPFVPPTKNVEVMFKAFSYSFEFKVDSTSCAICAGCLSGLVPDYRVIDNSSYTESSDKIDSSRSALMNFDFNKIADCGECHAVFFCSAECREKSLAVGGHHHYHRKNIQNQAMKCAVQKINNNKSSYTNAADALSRAEPLLGEDDDEPCNSVEVSEGTTKWLQQQEQDEAFLEELEKKLQ